MAWLSCSATCMVWLFSSFSVSPSILKIIYPFTVRFVSFLSVTVTWNVMFSSTSTLGLLFSVSLACLCLRFTSGVLLRLPLYWSSPE